MDRKRILMAGGGTGGHVVPLLAVAEELRLRGYEPWFVGTATGFEARLVPARGFPLEFIEIGGFMGLGLARRLRLLWQLPLAVLRCLVLLSSRGASACFSLGGYAAAPPVLACLLRGLPLVVMEPNAIPGLVNRLLGRFARRALLSFPQSARCFPPASVEITGLPVRSEFFSIPPKPHSAVFTLLITGGSQGSQTLNRAVRELWPLLSDSALPVHLIHQCGKRDFETISRDFVSTGLSGQVSAFLEDMPAAFAASDLVLCRAGAGAVSELAAAGRPAILVPFPFAADDHQTKNAQAFVAAGAALMFHDEQLTGPVLFEILRDFLAHPARLSAMADASRRLRKPGAAARAADILVEIIKTSIH
ncbi:MAG: undecaprenyldiphospho-muramoylpentapeptide beta-N-acetylglucosaminyltransferase [Acidobacteriota bacterium]